MLSTVERIVDFVWGNPNKNIEVSFENYSIFRDKNLVIDDIDAIKYAFKHLKFYDKWNPKKCMQAYRYAFDILCGAIDKPTDENWKFDF